MHQQNTTVSVIIEWKNQDLAADERADAMLDALRGQWTALAKGPVPPERSNLCAVSLAPCLQILFVYDGAAAKENLLTQLGTKFDTPAGVFAPRLIEGAGLSYYAMKNLGAERAAGDILIFLDSDVVPEPGWLAALLDAILTEDVQVVCGNTYIEPSGLVGKAFALGWFFPLRSSRCDLEVGARCYSNNIAFRRALFQRYPFEPVAGSTRAGMSGLMRTLDAASIAIHKCHAAQVSHPSPNGLSHIVRRAMAQGRDNWVKAQRDGAAGRDRLRVGVGESVRRLRAGLRRAQTDGQRVGVSAGELPVIIAIIVAYYAVAMTGTLMTQLAPGWMTRRLQL